MAKTWLVIALVITHTAGAQAANVGNLTGHSAEYVRTFHRNASIEADAAFYNPAGVTRLPEGISGYLCNQSWLLHASLTSQNEPFSMAEPLWLFMSGVVIAHYDDWAVYLGASPIGATGASMHVMAAMQTRGDAGPLQIDSAEVAGVFNMGGSAVANYASVLEPLR